MKSLFTSSFRRIALVTSMLAGAVAFIPTPVSAAATNPTTQFYTVGKTLTIPGVQVSGYDGKVVYASILVSSGSLEVKTTTDLTLPYGYTAFTGSRVAFTGTQTAVNNALKTLVFTPATGTPTNVTFSTTFFEDVAGTFFLPDNQHFYKVVTYPAGTARADKNWAVADAAAKASTFKGLTGYLANITSATENQFVVDKIAGARNIWIGGSDAAEEKKWVYTDGPDKGTQFWAAECNFNGTALGFNSWAKGEPNNYISSTDKCAPAFGGAPQTGIGEDCLVTNWSDGIPEERSGFWNDVPCDVSNNAYTANLLEGYLIEYGDKVNASSPTGVDINSRSLFPKVEPKPLTLGNKVANFVSGLFKALPKNTKITFPNPFAKKANNKAEAPKSLCPNDFKKTKVTYTLKLATPGRYTLYFTNASGKRLLMQCGTTVKERVLIDPIAAPVIQTVKDNETHTIVSYLRTSEIGTDPSYPLFNVVLRRADGALQRIDDAVQVTPTPIATKKRG